MALSTQRALPSLLSPESARHDVYLSFRGIDTRKGFVSHLYHELQHCDLQIGAPISQGLLSAIEQSYLAIVVLSPNYASSNWCLDELAKIVESMETRKNAILPVFLDVDPSDVRHQRRSFAEAFARHEENFSHDKLERWRAALTEVANLSGWDSKNYKCESELIQVIVSSLAEAFVTHEELSRHDIDKVERWAVANISGCDSKNYELKESLSNVCGVKCVLRSQSDSKDKLVGIDFGLVELGWLLDRVANDFQFIGLWGMGGVDKTTLAQLASLQKNWLLIAIIAFFP